MDGEYPVGGENQNISGISAVVRGTRERETKEWCFDLNISQLMSRCVVEVNVVSDEVSTTVCPVLGRAGLLVITVIMLQVAAITSGPHLGHPTPAPLQHLHTLCSLHCTVGHYGLLLFM